jgi:hypothetical protein
MDWCRGGGVRVADVDLLDARTTINYLSGSYYTRGDCERTDERDFDENEVELN